ncbi:CatB-related O-acetyltransferase [Flavobacterium luminosum]|uniref:CatB-related O-acetyltransferase n=1 Tax=Flavobacterium luminosum TaxID=2949086 RepID=A0ABT0TNP2_9FLAO|nr:CatB-related O-acetyltransferase [Flavobacterium sp. HXWNR70]MCL9809124.1 CatB-related O-acetyltransferase [Flavobacterium sp. HXWNR70]
MIKLLKILNAIRLDIKRYFLSKYNNVDWRLRNPHNYTTISKNVKNSALIQVGKYSYGEINVQSFENENEKLIIGNFVSIADNVVFVLGGNHQISAFTTYPLKAIFSEPFSKDDAQTKGAVVIEDEVWIGTNVMIMSGVTIGKGAIIAAGSIVVKDVAPFSIVGGNPADFLKWRIPENLIHKRSKMNLKDLHIEGIKKEMDLFYKTLDEDLLKEIEEKLC